MTETTKREELAWAAGFFDGEGCFTITKDKNGVPAYARCSINQIHPEVLLRFQAAVELGKVSGPYFKGNKRQPLYHFQCTDYYGTKAIYELLHPFLGSIKREQGRMVFEQAREPKTSKEFCKRGHQRVPENTTQWGQCLECRRIRDRERRPKKT